MGKAFRCNVLIMHFIKGVLSSYYSIYMTALECTIYSYPAALLLFVPTYLPPPILNSFLFVIFRIVKLDLFDIIIISAQKEKIIRNINFRFWFDGWYVRIRYHVRFNYCR